MSQKPTPGIGERQTTATLPPMRSSLTISILKLARAQHGLVSRRQLLDMRISSRLVDQRVSRGLLVPVAQGVYGLGHDALDQRARLQAALLASGSKAALSHWTAASVWGLAATRDRVEVLRGFNRQKANEGSRLSDRGRRWILVHRSRRLPRADFAVKDGFPLTSVARTMLDLAATTSHTRLRSMLRDAERLRIADWGALLEITKRGKGWKGIGRLRTALEDWSDAETATRSELELRFLDLCRRSGLELPMVNVTVSGVEVDCLWSGSDLIVELDGYEYHRGRTSFETDRRRDLELRSAGYEVLRVTHRMLRDEPSKVVELIKGRLEGGL